MSVHRFFVSPEELASDEVHLTGLDARHIAGPLRLHPGDRVTLADGRGGEATAVITSIGRGEVVVRVAERRDVSLPAFRICLFQGIPKGAKMDQIVSATTELGVDEIVPFLARRSVVRPGEDWAAHRLPRWRRIALESAKLAQRGTVPEVREPEDLAQILERARGLDLLLVPWEEAAEELDPDKFPNNPVVAGLVIGPEGGLHPDEVEALRREGGRVVSLGPNILRAETAAIVALALVVSALRRPSG